MRRRASLELQLYEWGKSLFLNVRAEEGILGLGDDELAFKVYQRRLTDACVNPKVAPKVGRCRFTPA